MADAQVKSFTLENDRVAVAISFSDGALMGETLSAAPEWLRQCGEQNPVSATTTADFGLDVMYTDWRAPGRQNNGDNPVTLSSKDFLLAKATDSTDVDQRRLLVVLLKGTEQSFDVRITYRLDPHSNVLRRKIAVRDSSSGEHFLRGIAGLVSHIESVARVVKAGDFGQPVALVLKHGGVFYGLESPEGDNRYLGAAHTVTCTQEIGERIGKEWLEGDWVAEGLTPDEHVKVWFFSYLDEIRVAPLRPYTLYNSWYDLRSPEYPQVPAENYMSEQSALKMVDLLKRNMMQKYNIALDAFVLDDGWDVYDSDWQLRSSQWPHGLKPLADTLKKTNTALGIWFGPTGGYSFHNRRITWMKEHGYEVVNNSMCIAGKNYGAMLQERTTGFVRNDGVGYFKWDGMQFSCSESGHGHPIDIYSRRAALGRVASMCQSVRGANNQMFLNLTSGTWLSPWWLKYANTIWMDGEDYGYADVPSISKRDAAITYRDFVLYEDFRLKGLWFPISNLMTHGIIKGKLEMLGSPTEPLDKFTDDVLLYVARGVSMYELYISPDIMSTGEWTSIARSIAWAKDRFSTLMHTSMAGGNPLQREAYGYVHCAGTHAVIAARNPVVERQTLRCSMGVDEGCDPRAKDLVLERVYPTRWISPRLYRCGDSVAIPLDGFETAVYEMYPLTEVASPLLAGAIFDEEPGVNGTAVVHIHSVAPDARVFNSGALTSISVDGKTVTPAAFGLSMVSAEGTHSRPSCTIDGAKGTVNVRCVVDTAFHDARLAILLSPDAEVPKSAIPRVTGILDGGKVDVESGDDEGRSRWFLIPVAAGEHAFQFGLSAGQGAWKGNVRVFLTGMERPVSHELVIGTTQPRTARILPPRIWKAGEIRRTIELGSTRE